VSAFPDGSCRRCRTAALIGGDVVDDVELNPVENVWQFMRDN
jgi:hypothetical protein